MSTTDTHIFVTYLLLYLSYSHIIFVHFVIHILFVLQITKHAFPKQYTFVFWVDRLWL